MAILYVGIDLAKNVFALHGVNELGKAELIRPAVPREKLHALLSSLAPCVIGMEACSGAHHWARVFQASGHTVRLIAPKFVTPYCMTGKRVQGAKSVVNSAHTRSDPISRWALALKERSGWQKAVVALANNNARILWAVMTRVGRFDPHHIGVKPGSATAA